jgi:hypothetical protein
MNSLYGDINSLFLQLNFHQEDQFLGQEFTITIPKPYSKENNQISFKTTYPIHNKLNSIKLEFHGKSLNKNYGYIRNTYNITNINELYNILNKFNFLKDKIRDIKITQILEVELSVPLLQ